MKASGFANLEKMHVQEYLQNNVTLKTQEVSKGCLMWFELNLQSQKYAISGLLLGIFI